MSLVNEILKQLDKGNKNPPNLGGLHSMSKKSSYKNQLTIWVTSCSVACILLSGAFFSYVYFKKHHTSTPIQAEKNDLAVDKPIQAVKNNRAVDKQVQVVKNDRAVDKPIQVVKNDRAVDKQVVQSFLLPEKPSRGQLMSAMAHDLGLMFGVPLYQQDMIEVPFIHHHPKSTRQQVSASPTPSVVVIADSNKSVKPINILASKPTWVRKNKLAHAAKPLINKKAVAQNWLDHKTVETAHASSLNDQPHEELQLNALAKQALVAARSEDTPHFNKIMMQLLAGNKASQKVDGFLQALANQDQYLVANRAIHVLLRHVNKNNPDTLKVMARFLLNQGETLNALNVLNRATPSIEVHPDYYSLQAYALLKMKDYKNSLILYKELTSMDSQQASWWLGLAVDYQGVNDDRHALSAFRMALKQSPENTAYKYYIKDKIQEILAGRS